MNNLTVQPITLDLMQDFIKWIDRPERTAKGYTANLRQFAAWTAYKGITRPTRDDVIAYRDYLSSPHEAIIYDPIEGFKLRGFVTVCKPGTIAEYLRTLKQFFSWTEAAGLYPNIARNIHGPKISRTGTSREALTAAEVVSIEDAIKRTAARKSERAAEERKDTAGRVKRSSEQGARLYAIYLLAVTAGLRTIEISRLNLKDFEERGGNAWIWVHGKGHTSADTRKAIAPEVADAVKAYLAVRPRGSAQDPLFIATGNRSGGKRIAPATISKMLKQAMIDAGYNSERLTAHSLRHTAGTAVMEMSGDLYATQRYMRHTSPATTEIYLHLNQERQEAETAADLWRYYHEAR